MKNKNRESKNNSVKDEKQKSKSQSIYITRALNYYQKSLCLIKMLNKKVIDIHKYTI